MNNLLNHTNGFFTPIFKVITLFGNSGIGFIILALILFLFKKTRKPAFCMLIAFLIGYISFELALKNIVRRPRPFKDTESIYYTFWQQAGSLKQSGFSFPSGHTTVAVEFAVVLFWFGNKKYSWVYFIIPLIMAMTRTYFMVHYLTDVLGGLMAGCISVGIMFIIHHFLEKTKWYEQLMNFNNFFLPDKKKTDNEGEE